MLIRAWPSDYLLYLPVIFLLARFSFLLFKQHDLALCARNVGRVNISPGFRKRLFYLGYYWRIIFS